MPSPTDAAAPARLRWADVAKGACILLVVLHHVITKHYDALVTGPAGPRRGLGPSSATR